MGEFAARLRGLRQENGESQNDLAKSIGISKSSINMYERGEREPGFETMEAIADHYNVDMDYLYGRTEIRNAYDELLKSGVDPSIPEHLKKDYEDAFNEHARAVTLRIQKDSYAASIINLIFDTLNSRGEAELLKYAHLLALDPQNCKSIEEITRVEGSDI